MSDKTLRLEIETYDNLLAFDIMDTDNVRAGTPVQVKDIGTITYEGGTVNKAVGVPETVIFMVVVAAGTEEIVIRKLIGIIGERAQKISINGNRIK